MINAASQRHFQAVERAARILTLAADRAESRSARPATRTQPAPVATPANEPTQATRILLGRNGHLLAGRHITRRRRRIRRYDGHWGVCSTLSSEPSRLHHDREGSSASGSAAGYCAAPAPTSAWHILHLAVHRPRRSIASVHIVFNHCRQIRTPGLHINPPPTASGARDELTLKRASGFFLKWAYTPAWLMSCGVA